MKLVNHNKNNSYNIDTYVMRGTITISKKEVEKCTPFFERVHLKCTKNGKYTNYGVTNTKRIVDILGLKNYKDVNYGVVVTK